VWHTNLTYFKVGLKKFYIYLVVDNFSKKVISHLVSDALNAKIRLKTIKEAYNQEYGSLEEDRALIGRWWLRKQQ
jgi:hypothetical protein